MSVNPESTGELLLQCLGARAAGSRVMLSDGEWDDVIRESAWQGVTPLLYHRIRSPGYHVEVPSRVTRQLRELAIGSAAKGLQLHQELGEVLGALSRDGIEVIVLKGAHLAASVYANRALRPMKDLDLMVKRRDLSRAEAKLIEMGYAQRPEAYAERDYSDCHHLHPLGKPGGATIELHWTIESPTAPFAIEVDELWERARPTTTAGVEVLVLAAEDLVLHLCLHTAFHHRFERGLRGCWDILETVRNGGDIDWEQIRERARRWGARKHVYLALRLAAELVGASVPAQVLRGLKPDGFELGLIALARAEILRSPTGPSLSAPFTKLWGASRLREKASLLARTVFPSRDSIGRLYPACRDSRWLYLYYPVRWADLLRMYGRAAWRMVLRDEAVTTLVQREHQRAVLMNWLESGSLEAP